MFDKFRTIRILVVDDEPTIRHRLKRWIASSTAAEMVEAENGLQGLEKLSSSKIDLVILDLNMPVLDGIEMLSLIRTDPAHSDLEVIVASTVGSEAKVREVISLGVSDYLLKPLEHDRVNARLEAAFERIMEKRQQRANQGNLSRTRSLVADTDSSFLEFASAALGAQFATQGVRTIGEVLVKMLSFKPDVILISPKMAGDRLTFLLEKNDNLAKKGKVAIYLLVDSPPEKVREARIAGAVTRTFVPETFAASVAGLLGGGPAPGHGILSWISSIEPEIHTALRQALGMMTGSEPVPVDTVPGDPGFDRFGFIALESAGKDFELVIEVQCQKAFARSLVRLMLGCKEEEIDEEAQASGLQEILNVVAGRVKNSCRERKIEVLLGLPKISGEVPPRPRNILHQTQLHFAWEQGHTFQLTFFGCTTQQPSDSGLASLTAPAGGPAQALPLEGPVANGDAPPDSQPREASLADMPPEGGPEPGALAKPDGASSQPIPETEKAPGPAASTG